MKKKNWILYVLGLIILVYISYTTYLTPDKAKFAMELELDGNIRLLTILWIPIPFYAKLIKKFA